jgi:hypothetical protein
MLIMSARRSRTRDNKQKNKITPKIFYIACEGEKDELEYFENIPSIISRRFENLIKIIPIERKNGSAPKKVWAELSLYIQENKIKFNKREDNIAFMVIDKDHHFKPNHVADSMLAVREAQRAGIIVLCSNPCFEIWRYCHYVDLSAKSKEFRDKSFINKKHFLKQEFAKVRDGEKIIDMLKRIRFALDNEKKLNELSHEQDPVIPKTLYSKVGVIISMMLELGFELSV